MRVIGIDPGTVCCGYGIVEVTNRSTERSRRSLKSQISNLKYITAGEIQMNRKDALPERLKILYNSLRAIFNEYKPSHLCIEKIFYHKSIRSAFALGSTRGIVMLLAAEMGMPVFEYNSTQVKMALTGFGRAEKRQVQSMVKRLLNLNVSEGVSASESDSQTHKLSEDTTDALALCICHINCVNELK